MLIIITLAVISAIITVGGDQRIVHVCELISDKGLLTDSNFTCCAYGNCSSTSLDIALASLTSNVLINITTNVTLSSIVKLSDLKNISIIGCNNPTVNCRNIGGIHFTFCHNFIFKGITWDGCGSKYTNHYDTSSNTEERPGLKLSYSSNIMIQNCLFQHSIGQVVTLLMSINVVISNCGFFNNQGTCVHVINQNLQFNGKILFQNNTGKHGSGIYIWNNSTVVFIENADVTFIRNSALRGGAVFLGANSSMLFDQSSTGIFTENIAKNGIIYSEINSNVTFSASCKVKFNDNSADYGAAIYSNKSNIAFMGKSVVAFSNNQNSRGGTIYSFDYSNIWLKGNSTTVFYNNANRSILAYNSNIFFEQNSVTKFCNNSADNGGAIIIYKSTVYFEEDCMAEFRNNIAVKFGGAIHSRDGSYIYFRKNSTIILSNNSANNAGGAISLIHGYMSFNGNSCILLYNNTANKGGTIYTSSSNTFFEGNSTSKFYNSSASEGGAIKIYKGAIYFKENSTTEFIKNVVKNFGGAIDSGFGSYIYFESNSATTFNGNLANNMGGAISLSQSFLTFKGNSSACFHDNTASKGGAIYNLFSNISSGDESRVEFFNNTAIRFGKTIAYNEGGGICSTKNSYITFGGNSFTMFHNNTADNNGKSIFTGDYSVIRFSDNSTVTFTKNEAISGAIVYSFDNSRIMATGDSRVIINDLPAKWCVNACIPYTSLDNDAILIDSNGIVWCSNTDSEAFTCISKKCYDCKKLEDILVTNSTTKVLTTNISDAVLLSSSISLENLKTISIVGHNKLTVLCVNGSGVSLKNCSSFTVEGITWVGCGDIVSFQSVLSIYKSIKVTINNCSFQNSMGVAITVDNAMGNVSINDSSFISNNQYKGHGVCIKYTGSIPFLEKHHLTINNCNFVYNGASNSIVFIRSTGYRYFTSYIINSNFYNNKGVPFCLLLNSFKNINVIHIIGKVLFVNNMAKSGAGIYSRSGTVVFDKDSYVKFINNSVEQGGAGIFINRGCNIIFGHNSKVEFENNKATNGTIYSDGGSSVIFAATCQVTFSGNSVTQCGAAIYSIDNSSVTFTGRSNLKFNNNVVSSNSKHLQLGGNIFSKSYSTVSFEDDSVAAFANNSADFGAAILSLYASRVAFKGRSMVMFNNNNAYYCGILVSALYSSINFNDTAKVVYNSNMVSGLINSNDKHFEAAGTMCTFKGATIIFSGYSQTIFINNKAVKGGVAVFSESNVMIEKHATLTIKNNLAVCSTGGAFICHNITNITLKDNSKAHFYHNYAGLSGGAIHSYNVCKITFKDNSTSAFINNTARDSGGVIISSHNSEIAFEGNATVTFNNNIADNGGVFYATSSTIIFTDLSAVLFSVNSAKRNGGVGYFFNSTVIFKGSTIVKFSNNLAEQNAGVLYSAHSCISFKENSSLKLTYNTVTLNGGALYFDTNSNVTLSQFSNLNICHNRASYGGAILANNHSSITLTGNPVLSMESNKATQYGGAIFLEITAVMIDDCSSKNCVNFTDNIANVLGDSLYLNIPQMRNNIRFSDKVVGIDDIFISTPPKVLRFNYPAMCINKDNTKCYIYHMQNIMLGTEIVIPACALDFYNHSVNNTQFLLQNEVHPNCFISGPKQVLISCYAFRGISIMCNQTLTKSTNYSINITLNTVFNPTWKPISVNLTIELSPCHLGFWQYPKSLKCECYNANDIVFCSDTSSTIKRGYWFGSVTGKPTVTLCPINYCNFTCCETSNGYYQLSPVRDDQCRSHRTGTACGQCTNGYTLSFDSPECVKVENCTVGKTVLVILLTLVYWIILVALVFVMMYYKVGICYLYSITYYYSVVDILINQNLQASRGLDITVNILSSFSKITPQFLGELCLTIGMSGIDQQFIHYMHPSAIIVILVTITLSARKSQRISNIIRRGIIHAICLLLLLSYTSMASTSLLLMRPLKFQDIDKVYTYLSPDIEYFHGRHLAYSIVALLCTISIVIGLPLLLILEPFLNHRINFIKIKPLLDQFQGSYKDKCRCFAGYYMICRLLIIIIVIINSSNDSITSYALITVCGTIALIHLMIKPYANNEILNRFDGVILQLIIFIAALQLPENLESLSVTFVLITLPLLMFIVMTFYLNRYNLKKIITYFINKILSTSNDGDRITDYGVRNDSELREFNTITVDDSQRKNAIICDV